MKFLSLAMLPLALMICSLTASLSASERVEVKDNDGRTEFRMKVTRHDGHYYGWRDGHEYRLRGDAVVRFHDEGDYYVTGRVLNDNDFEVVETRPYVVEERPAVIHEREVIHEHHHEPFIKVGPLEVK